jgi:hypothetical protein
MAKNHPVFPTKKALVKLVKAIKEDVRQHGGNAFSFQTGAKSLTLTVGASGEGRDSWSFQTGDNSFMGGAYLYPHWAVVEVSVRDNAEEVADDILDQLANLWHSANG